MFWVISVQFDLRNTLPKLGPFLLGHPVYIHIYTYIYNICIKHAMCNKSNAFEHYTVSYRYVLLPPDFIVLIINVINDV